MEYTTLDKISENLDSKRKPITSSDRVEGEIPYYGASGIVDYVKDYIFDEVLLLVSEDGANLLARSTPIAFSVSGKTWINNHAHVLRFSNKNLQKFVEIYLNSISLESYVTGSAQPKLNQKMLNEIPIPVVEDSQIEIVVNLAENLKSIIELRKQELSCFDDLIKARFVEMFGDPIINSFGIETKPMTDVCEIIDGDRGKNYPTADEFSDEGYCLFLNAKNVTSTGFNFDTCMFVTKEKDEALRKGKLSRGDVVLTTRGTLGNLAFYTKAIPFEHVRINSGMVILRMKQDVVDEVYFIEQFKMQLADIREKIASGSAQPQLPISTMNKINILIPNIEKQRRFADFVYQVDKSKFKESCYIKYKILKIRHHQIYLLRK